MKLSKSPDIKICQHRRRSQKCVFKKKNVKLSKSPDIKICQHRRSQKCVFKKMKLSKSPDIKISLHVKTGLKMCVQKNETLKKS